MPPLIQGLFRGIWQPQLQFVRFKNKINITKPKPPHFKRAVVEHICVPYYSVTKRTPKYLPRYELCSTTSFTKKQKSPLEKILAREVFERVNNSKLIAVFHMNAMNSDEKFDSAVLLKRNGLNLMAFGKSIMSKAFSGTIYEPLLSFYQSRTAIAVSQELNLQGLMKITNKMPCLTLMAGLINQNRLLDYAEMVRYSKFSSIETARLHFLSVLNISSQNLVNHLNHHPNSLLQCLKQIKEPSNEKP